jgi:hypothetical protein
MEMTKKWVIMSDDQRIPPHPAIDHSDAIAKATQIALGKPVSGVHIFRKVAVVRSETKACIEFTGDVGQPHS